MSNERKPQAGYGIHANWEHEAPKRWRVSDRRTPNQVFPNPQQQQERDPPCRPCSHEERYAVDEWLHEFEVRNVAFSEDESRTRIGRDRGRAHHNPERTRDV